MPGIYTSCPATGATVPTGQQASPMFLEGTLDAGGRFRCSACNQVHTWTRETAIVGATKAYLRKDPAYEPRMR